jgi:Protein of unknown function (DUF3891)
MILRENPSSYVLINQHDHAGVAGEMAAHWHPDYFAGPERRPEVLLAIREHDCGWIPLDEHGGWDATGQRPFSFIDYPLAPKLQQYSQGISEVEASNAYAALLCSLHYTTFPDLDTTAEGRAFLQAEQARQQKIKATLALTTPRQDQELFFHLQLLKCCDGLSIYLCINKPGVTKAQEHPWYQHGIPQSTFSFTQGRNLEVMWRNSQTVQIRPFPFTQAFVVTIPYRQVSKQQIQLMGGRQAQLQAPYQQYQVHLVP